MIRETGLPASWLFLRAQAFCDMTAETYSPEQCLAGPGPTDNGKKEPEPVHVHHDVSKERINIEAPYLVFRNGVFGFRGVGGFPFETQGLLWIFTTIFTTITFHGRRPWGRKCPREECPLLLTYLMTFLPKKILSQQEEVKVMINHFGVRFIEFKELQLKSF